ncbi:HAD family hydrolase [Petrotoga sp. Shatin.DS.tank11.9.2.9.3]|uniref:HAD-IIIC family phosphatase n=1 Tax=Petrotoga sp. Shatin.DS.tank11.9.2.9.3 TaxID=1469556 RepID=UPI001F1A7BA2|nr:HAD-IIIC family phosphatase [Petrotoga sp. Shatin.DS.tank11.9.2.9.3]
MEKELSNYIDIIEKAVKDNSDKKFFVSTIDVHEDSIHAIKDFNIKDKEIENNWLKHLYKLNNDYPNFFIFDLKELITNVGRKNFYSKKLWYLGGMKFSNYGENIIVEEITNIINALEKSRKKCLVLDLDNTLWGGVVGDIGIENIELSEFKEGARYKDFQKRIKELKELGVLLAICSKNEENYAMDVFEKNKEMVLKSDDFIIKKINWQPKSKNISEIADELNIGLDSIVFIDDSRFEREEVKSNLPQVIVPEFPEDTSNLENFIIDVYKNYFYTINQTEEDKKKTKMYVDNIKRETEKKKSASIDEFLEKLNTKIYLWKLKPENLQRAHQLIHKTNQFNLTTKRYSEKQLQEFMNDPYYEIYVSRVEDKFGDNGIVFLLIAKKDDNKILIDSLIMSCRVMERFIEDRIISYLEDQWFKDGFQEIESTYLKTERNKPVENLFERLGYEVTYKDENKKIYRLNKKIKPNRKKIGELIVE